MVSSYGDTTGGSEEGQCVPRKMRNYSTKKGWELILISRKVRNVTLTHKNKKKGDEIEMVPGLLKGGEGDMLSDDEWSV